jgi:hypothetical protein
LPDFLLERRLDHVEVIGCALVLGIVIGLGMRKVANPVTTARGWRRRFRVRAAALTAAVVAVAVHLDPAAVLLDGDHGETAAMQVVGAAWQRARRRFGDPIPRLWRFWSWISGGQALGTKRSHWYLDRMLREIPLTVKTGRA